MGAPIKVSFRWTPGTPNLRVFLLEFMGDRSLYQLTRRGWKCPHFAVVFGPEGAVGGSCVLQFYCSGGTILLQSGLPRSPVLFALLVGVDGSLCAGDGAVLG
jgi:hypothetical protein